MLGEGAAIRSQFLRIPTSTHSCYSSSVSPVTHSCYSSSVSCPQLPTLATAFVKMCKLHVVVSDVREELVFAVCLCQDGACHVVVSDVREELVVYINGKPYIRRELEMPSAALHHAGIHAMQV